MSINASSCHSGLVLQRRLGRLAALCLLAAFMVVSHVAPAEALLVHHFERSFGTQGSGPGQLNHPLGIAVNDSAGLAEAAGDVYVADAANNRVERFSATGEYLGQFNGSGTYEDLEEVEPIKAGEAAPTGAFLEPTEVAVDDSSNPLDPSREDVYVVDDGHGVIDKFTARGEYIGQLKGTTDGPFGIQPPANAVAGIAVDLAGKLWVTTAGGPFYSFSDAVENEQISEHSTEFKGAAEGLAVDAEDHLYAYIGGGRIVKLGSTGETLSNPFGNDREALKVAMDPGGDEVYVDNSDTESPTIEAFTTAGEAIEGKGENAQSPAFGAGQLTFSRGIAVNAGGSMVYATEAEGDSVVVFRGNRLPNVVAMNASERLPKSVTLNGTVNPEGEDLTSCVFEYDTKPYRIGEASHGTQIACSPPVVGSSGTSPIEVSAHVEGLESEQTYYYRLVAEDPGGTAASRGGEIFTGPRLEGESVADVAATSATLMDSVNPDAADTTYYVEYGPTTEYGFYAPSEPPGADLGSSTSSQSISTHVQNLDPGVLYHYRFVAVQAGETFAEADNTFTTQETSTSSELLDGRMWEMVSPPNKQGGLIELFENGGEMQAASDGSAITYLSTSAFGEDPVGEITHPQLLSKRTGGSWTTTDLTLPGRLPEDGHPAEEIAGDLEYRLFSPTLSSAVVEPPLAGTPPLPPDGPQERTLYLRNEDNIFTPLVTEANVTAGAKIEEVCNTCRSAFAMHYLAATPSLESVLFETPLALTSEAFDEENPTHFVWGKVKENLYEWKGGALHLINLLPNGDQTTRGENTPVAQPAGIDSGSAYARDGLGRVISSDGTRVAWTWGQPYIGLPYRGLYIRDVAEERTVQVGGSAAVYQTMNSSGSRVFYLENGDLYVFEAEKGPNGASTDLTAAHEAGETSAEVQELVSDVSEDGSYVYFVAKTDLPSRSTDGAAPVSGADNLYLLHDGEGGWVTTYIATLSENDRPTWYRRGQFGGGPNISGVTSRVSPDGRFLTFMSEHPLTGYDNRDVVGGERDEEVYLFDADADALACLSCDPSGARPEGVFDEPGAELLVDRVHAWTDTEASGENLRTNHWLAGSVPGWDDVDNNPASYQPRYLSNSGRTFFDSPIGLVPGDTNGLEDVYEFEPDGVGGCSSSVHTADAVYVKASDGCVGLVSSGISGSESAFYDASEDGDDVFFDTTARLVGEDRDDAYDLYDAHVCTSAVPCRSEAIAPPPCTSGDSCKAAPSPQPAIFGPPPSATFHGAGNAPTAGDAGQEANRPVTSAAKLAAALKLCRNGGSSERRRKCESRARKRYRAKRAVQRGKASKRGRR